MTATALALVLATSVAGVDAPQEAAFDLTTRAAPTGDTHDDLVGAHRTLTGVTLGSLLATGALGTIIAINRPTLLSEGRCTTQSPLLGEYGCGSLSTVHGGVAALALISYTSTRVLGWVLQRTERWAPSRVERILEWINVIGLAALPVVGLAARYPELIGIDDPDRAQQFQRVSRTLHLAAGYAIIGTYTATAVMRLYF